MLSMRQYGIDRHGADCDVLRRRLQEVDKLFEIEFDYDSEKYLVYFNKALFQATPYKEFNAETLEHILKVYDLNVRGTIIEYVDEANERHEQTKEKERGDLSRELAKDLHKQILKEI